MRKFIIMAALAAGFGLAAVAQTPVQYYLPIPAANVAQDTEWTVPLRQDGALLAWQALDAGSAETLSLKHISVYATGKAYTNTIESAAARNTLHVYPVQYLPPQYYATNDVIFATTPKTPVYLQAGDRLSFRLSATNATTTVIIKTTLRE